MSVFHSEYPPWTGEPPGRSGPLWSTRRFDVYGVPPSCPDPHDASGGRGRTDLGAAGWVGESPSTTRPRRHTTGTLFTVTFGMEQYRIGVPACVSPPPPKRQTIVRGPPVDQRDNDLCSCRVVWSPYTVNLI